MKQRLQRLLDAIVELGSMEPPFSWYELPTANIMTYARGKRFALRACREKLKREASIRMAATLVQARTGPPPSTAQVHLFGGVGTVKISSPSSMSAGTSVVLGPSGTVMAAKPGQTPIGVVVTSGMGHGGAIAGVIPRGTFPAGSSLAMAAGSSRSGPLIHGSYQFVWGMPLERKPYRGLLGNVRIRYRNDDFARVFIRNPYRIRKFLLVDKGDHVTHGPEEACNDRNEPRPSKYA